jgi:predicted DNA-binding ribbon-helix-helix protein
MSKSEPSMRTKDPRGRSLIATKHVRLGDHQASVCLEGAFWLALKEIATAQGSSMARLIREIDSERRELLQKNLSSAVRLFILDHYRNRCGLEWPEHRTPANAPPLIPLDIPPEAEGAPPDQQDGRPPEQRDLAQQGIHQAKIED